MIQSYLEDYMKYLALILLLTPCFSFAGNCGTATNVTINYEASSYALEPAVFYVKEGDRVCIRLESVDGTGKNLRMEQAYFWLKANKNLQDEALYYARKKGEYKVTCTGCEKGGILIVEDAKTFDARQKRQYQKESMRARSPHWDSQRRSPSYKYGQ